MFDRRTCFLCAALAATGSAHGSDLLEATSLNDRIVLLHFDDGYVAYHGRGQRNEDDRTVAEPLDLKKAAKHSSYLVRAGEKKGIQPVRVGRKSKGMDWSRKCLWNGKQCDNDVVFEHWIYLELPEKLKRGKRYEVEFKGLGAKPEKASFVFDEFATRSEAIHVNHVGYLPDAREKFAYVSQWMGDLGPLNLDDYAGRPFHLVDAKSKEEVLTGKLALRKDLETGGPDTGQDKEGPNVNFIGADLFECDFSTLTRPGEYFLVVEGVGRSFPFKIGEDVYREAFYTTCRGLFHERAGIELKKEYTDWSRPRDHHPDDGGKVIYSERRVMDVGRAEGQDNDKEVLKLAKGPIRTWGWYHDAGDWDGYPSHLIIPRYLLTVYELKPGNFADGELDLPESGNGVPDIVDEAAWLINYLKRTRGPTGGIAGTRVHAIGGRPDGREAHGVPSWEDTRTWYVYGEEPRASYSYASLAAQYAYCLKLAGAGKREVKGWIKEAEAAYRWAGSNLREGDDKEVGGVRLAADAWIYKATGDEKHHARFKDAAARVKITPAASNPHEEQWAVWAYLTMPEEKTDANLRKKLLTTAVKWADELNVETAEKRGFRAGWHWFVPTVIGFNSTPHVIESIVAYELTGEKKYLDVVQTTCDYMLGGNGLNMCWVSGLGHRCPRLFLHIDSWYDDKKEQIPGIVPYAVCAPKKPVSEWVGPWDTNMMWDKGVYPSWEKWPLHEGYADNPYGVMGNEFTVHQNVAPAAAVYGYLCAEKK